MHPALEAAAKLKAQQETAAAIARAADRLDSIEAKIDRLLAAVEPQKAAPGSVAAQAAKPRAN